MSALEELRPGKQWVVFTEDKIPYSPRTGKAKANDPTTCETYEEATKALQASPQSYIGIGREFLKEQGITGVDLDHCIDEQGNISEYAQDVLKRLNSYAEQSPNDGIHVWVYGSIPRNLVAFKPTPDGIEIYDHGRYFTFTGKHLPGTPMTIEHRQEELKALYQETVERRRATKQRTPKNHTKPRTRLGDGTPYGLQALKNESHILSLTQPGARNDQLNTSAYSLGQLIAGKELSRSTVERELSAVAARIGLND